LVSVDKFFIIVILCIQLISDKIISGFDSYLLGMSL